MASRRPADWRFPTEKQRRAEETARLIRRDPEPPTNPSPPVTDDTDPGWWDAVLADQRAAGPPRLPIQARRLAEIPREILRVECLRCFRAVEIRRDDAVRLYGPHAIWKDVGGKLLEDGCQARTGNRDQDGCAGRISDRT
jgi:hypothetical protein